MRIDILKEGDAVINVNRDFISVRRANGEVDLVPLIEDETVTVIYKKKETMFQKLSPLDMEITLLVLKLMM